MAKCQIAPSQRALLLVSDSLPGKPCLPRDRCCNRPHLDVCAASFLRRIKQKLTAAQINGSRPFAHAEDRPLAKTGDRLILKSEFTPGLDTGLHRCPLANIIVYR